MPFAPDDLLPLKTISSLRLSPDAQWLAVNLSEPDLQRDRRIGRLQIVPVRPGPGRTLLAAEGTRPRWGGGLLFALRSRQIVELSLSTGEARPVAELPAALGEWDVSADGRWAVGILRTPRVPRKLAEFPGTPQAATLPVVIDHAYFRDSDSHLVPPITPQLALIDLVAGTMTVVAHPAGTYLEDVLHGGRPSPQFSPDGGKIVLSLAQGFDENAQLPHRNRDLYCYDIASEKWTVLTSDVRTEVFPAFSPDGRQVAFLRQRSSPTDAYYFHELCVLELDSGRVRSLTAHLDLSPEMFEWSGDGSHFIITYSQRAQGYLAALRFDGSLVVRVTGVRLHGAISPTPGLISGAASGDIAFCIGRPDSPGDAAVVSPDGAVTNLTDLNPWLRDRQLSTVGDFEYVSAHVDRRAIHAIVAMPPQPPPPGGKLPVIVNLHGGPYSAAAFSFSPEREFYCGLGYIHVEPNYRGSTGHGEAFAKLSDRKHYPGWVDDPTAPHEMGMDVVGILDALAARPEVDPARIYLRGFSAGAMLTSWTIGRTDRFRAAVAQCWYPGNWSAPDYGAAQIRTYFDGPPWDPRHTASYWRSNPALLVGNVRTPLMLVQGDIDNSTPLMEAEKYYYTLRTRGVDTVLAIMPGEDHGMTQRPYGLRNALLLEHGWFNQHGAGMTAMPE